MTEEMLLYIFIYLSIYIGLFAGGNHQTSPSLISIYVLRNDAQRVLQYTSAGEGLSSDQCPYSVSCFTLLALFLHVRKSDKDTHEVKHATFNISGYGMSQFCQTKKLKKSWDLKKNKKMFGSLLISVLRVRALLYA